MNERKPQVTKKQAPITLISLGLIAVTILVMFILCLVPGAGKNPKNPILVIYGDDGNIPARSLTNTLHAAGFEYEVLDYGNDLPEGGPFVIMAMGHDALSVINEHKDDPGVAGFILVCPEVDETCMTGLSSVVPACDVAIFAGRDNSTAPKDMGGARLIYERLSGDDTFYGVPVRRGGLFASKVFVNNAQNRTLSLSCFNVSDPSKLLFSPLFQNELAGYLSVTYIDESTRETSFGRINSWFVLSLLTMAFFVAGVLLYISNMSLSQTGNDPKKAPVSNWVFGLIGGVSIAVAIGIVASTSVNALREALLWILTLLPCLFMGCLFGINFKWIYAKEGKFIPKRSTLVPAGFMAVTVGLAAMFILALTTDLKVHAIEDAGLSTGLLGMIMVVDMVLSTGLIYASRKSSAAGEGAKNCFGNRRIFMLMFLPSAVALIYGLLPGHTMVFYSGLAGIASTGLPYLAVMPVVRHTDRSLIAGILHSVVYVLILAAAL